MKNWTAIPLVMTLILAPFIGHAASTYNNPELDFSSAQTLRGIGHVIIQINGLDDKYAPYGLQQGDLIEAISKQLRGGHLEVSNSSLESAADDTALLEVRLRLNETAYYYYSYSLSLNIIQRIPLARENTSLNARTWSNGINGVTTPSEMSRLKQQILTLVDEFLNAHQQQN
jgi:hypothetical protein